MQATKGGYLFSMLLFVITMIQLIVRMLVVLVVGTLHLVFCQFTDFQLLCFFFFYHYLCFPNDLGQRK